MFAFAFEGGSFRNSPGIQEKFLLLAIINKKEIFLHQAIKAGIVRHIERYGDTSEQQQIIDTLGITKEDGSKELHQEKYLTEVRTWKLFISISGFGIPKRYYNIYFSLKDMEEKAPILRVSALSTEVISATSGYGQYTNARFTTKAAILNRDEIEKIITGDSLDIWRKSPPMPIPLARTLIQVDRGALTETIRSIRFKRKEV